MNQQQATEFIQLQLQQGRTNQEITELLSPQLKAPPDLVAKFVEKVASQVKPASQAMPAPQASSTPQPPCSAFISVPPAQPVQPTTTQPPAQNAVPEKQPILAPVPAPGGQTPVQQPSPQQVSASTYTVLPNPPKPVPPPAVKSTAIEDPKLAAYVAKRLRAQHRKSDIAMEVCERTGVDWKEAQRFVNQVNLEQYQSISRAKNIPVLVFCGLFIFSGVVLLILGVLSALPYISLFFGSSAELTVLPDTSIQTTVYLLLGGIGLILGGLVGFYVALRQQMD